MDTEKDEMKERTVKEIVSLLGDLPESKVRSVVEFIHFLRWSEDTFTDDEIAIIRKSREEAAAGKGTPWRDVRDDV